jgi:hypothetical protein
MGLGFLAATVYGVAKGLAGETVRFPFLGDLADRLRF